MKSSCNLDETSKKFRQHYSKFGRNLEEIYLDLNQFQVRIKQIIDERCKENLDKNTAKFRQNIDEIWTKFRLNLDEIWMKFG